MNDAARLVDELTTLLYSVLKRWEANGRIQEIVQCGACRKKADKPESVVHDSDCPVYRLQRAEDVNSAVIKANAEEIADLEDARDAADARANAEWARAEMLTQDNDRLRERAEQAERERDAADEEAQNARSVAQMAASDRDEAMDNFDNLSLELERLEKQLTADNAALRERLATVEAALIRLRAGCMVPAGTACRLCHGTWLREDGETAADHHDGCPLKETAPGAALDVTPAAGEVE